MRKSLLFVSSLLVLTTPLAPSVVDAQAPTVRVQEVAARVIRVDGRMRDWDRIDKVQLGSGDDAALRYAFAYDDEGLYVGADVSDERVIRTARPGNREDVIVVTIATPNVDDGGAIAGYQATEFWLYPGESGRDAAALSGRLGRRPRPARDVDVVEGPRASGVGYQLEAYIPFERIPGAERIDSARIAIRLHDVDQATRSSVEDTLSNTDVELSADNLARLPAIEMTGRTHGSIRGWRDARSLGAAPIHREFWGDVAGDARQERVVFIGREFAVMGPGYRDGQSFDFEALPIRGPDDVQRARLEDMTGDGKAELVMRVRVRDRYGLRAVWKVFGINVDERGRGTGVDLLFSVEVFERTRAGIVRSNVRVRPQRRAAPLIEVSLGESEGVQRRGYRRPPADDDHTVQILLPWGPVRQRTYQWAETAFREVSSEPNPDAYVPPQREVGRDGGSRGGPDSRPAQDRPREPARPSSPSGAQRIAEVRRAQGIGADVPVRFEQRAQLAGTRALETVAVLGGAIVVHGDEYQSGRGYFYQPVAQPDDVLSLRAVDITGDGRAEILVTVRQHLGEYERDVLVVYHFADQTGRSGFATLLQVEVARYHGPASGSGSRVVNQVDVRGRARRARLRIRPGRAQGWDASSWPFSGFADDGVDALLLPWQDDTVTYGYDGTRLAPQ